MQVSSLSNFPCYEVFFVLNSLCYELPLICKLFLCGAPLVMKYGVPLIINMQAVSLWSSPCYEVPLIINMQAVSLWSSPCYEVPLIINMQAVSLWSSPCCKVSSVLNELRLSSLLNSLDMKCFLCVFPPW